MIFAGIFSGMVLFGLVVSLNLLVMKNAGRMPPKAARRYIVQRYFFRIAGLIILLGGVSRVAGLMSGFGILAGMVLGNLVFLLMMGSKKRMLIKHLVSEQGRPG